MTQQEFNIIKTFVEISKEYDGYGYSLPKDFDKKLLKLLESMIIINNNNISSNLDNCIIPNDFDLPV